jgi:hypothetical protein
MYKTSLVAIVQYGGNVGLKTPCKANGNDSKIFSVVPFTVHFKKTCKFVVPFLAKTDGHYDLGNPSLVGVPILRAELFACPFISLVPPLPSYYYM